LWNNGLRTSGFATFPLLVDEPTKLLVVPRKLVTKNGLKKQVENNTECKELLGEMCLRKEMDINHSKGLLA
jgi:hypothetical protein